MKRTVSIILILVMAITIYIPMTAEHSYGASVRTTMPGLDSAEGKTYYYNKNNPFYAAKSGRNELFLQLQAVCDRKLHMVRICQSQ